ncbi:hypothetical protein MRX96_004675 [Rhipicephalus microplus]
MAPAVNQADAESEPPRYFLRSHARQVSQEPVAEKRKLEARGKSSGKMRCLWSPPEQAQPMEDLVSASPGQHCSQGLPHGTTCSNGIRRHDSTDGSDGVWASRRVASRKSTRNRLCDVSPSGNCIAHGRSSCLRLAGPAQCRRRATCSRTSNSAS